MSRRAPTAADVQALEADLRRRGFEIYCGPSYYAAGHCRPGKHPHGQFSRHFAAPGMAVDFGWPGPPIHDLEALHVELLMEELGRHPTIRWRRLWNLGPGDHQDHGHVDDAYGWRGYIERVTPRPGVRARDGKDLFVSPRAFPQHVPPTNSGYTLAAIVAFQELAPRLTNPKTGRPFYGGHADGYLGKVTRAAVKAIQGHLGLTVDGLPGPRTMSALRAAIDRQNNPPKPDPEEQEMERKLDQILANQARIEKKIDARPSAGDIAKDVWRYVIYGFHASWWLRRGLITDPTHRNFPADPGSPADKELRREAAESGRATVNTPTGPVLVELDQDGAFKIKEN